MEHNETPYGETEYRLMLEKLDGFCGKFSNQMLFEELSREAIKFSKKQSTNLWNKETSKQFIEHILESWTHSYCAILAAESVLKELSISYPQTTFSHISSTLRELTFLSFSKDL